MSVRRRCTLVILTGASLAGVVASIAYLIVNIWVIPARIRSPELLVTAENAEVVTASLAAAVKSISGLDLAERVVDLLGRMSVDLSAVTPFLLLWFFWSIGWYSLASLRSRLSEKELYDGIETLPMPSCYESIGIQLGLLGTIWGFLVIGLGIALNRDVNVMDILLQGFGTALLSTFTAVFLVHVCAPLARMLWRWAHDIKPETGDLESRLQATEKQLGHLVDRLAATGGEVAKLDHSLARLHEQIAAVRVADVLVQLERAANATETIARRMENVEALLGSIPRTLTAGFDRVLHGSEAAAANARDRGGLGRGDTKREAASLDALSESVVAIKEAFIGSDRRGGAGSGRTPAPKPLLEQITAARGEVTKTVQSGLQTVDQRLTTFHESFEGHARELEVRVPAGRMEAIAKAVESLLGETRALNRGMAKVQARIGKLNGWGPRFSWFGFARRDGDRP